MKLPKDRFDLVLALFALLQRIATVGTNDSQLSNPNPLDPHFLILTLLYLYHIVTMIIRTNDLSHL